jgi:hypothetical protein
VLRPKGPSLLADIALALTHIEAANAAGRDERDIASGTTDAVEERGPAAVDNRFSGGMDSLADLGLVVSCGSNTYQQIFNCLHTRRVEGVAYLF